MKRIAALVVLILTVALISPASGDAYSDYRTGDASFDAMPRILRVIAFCESSFDPAATNGTTTASGLWQFTDPTWRDVGAASAFGVPRAKDATVRQQAQAALHLYSQRGSQPWDASKPCWSTRVDYIPSAAEIKGGGDSTPTPAQQTYQSGTSNRSDGLAEWARTILQPEPGEYDRRQANRDANRRAEGSEFAAPLCGIHKHKPECQGK